MRTIISNPTPAWGKLGLLAQAGDARGQEALGKKRGSAYTSVGNGILTQGYSGSRPLYKCQDCGAMVNEKRATYKEQASVMLRSRR